MIELFGLFVGALFLGVVFVVGGLVLLPFYILFRVLGFAAKMTFGALALVLGGIILLPLAIVVGLLLLAKVLVIGIPLLLVGLMLWWLVGFLSPAAA